MGGDQLGQQAADPAGRRMDQCDGAFAHRIGRAAQVVRGRPPGGRAPATRMSMPSGTAAATPCRPPRRIPAYEPGADAQATRVSDRDIGHILAQRHDVTGTLGADMRKFIL